MQKCRHGIIYRDGMQQCEPRKGFLLLRLEGGANMFESPGSKTVELDTETMQPTRQTAIPESSQLDPNALGLACGIFWAGAVAAIGVTARVGWGKRWEQLLADMYRGFSETRSGLIIGATWALLDGFTSGYIVASLYNLFRK